MNIAFLRNGYDLNYRINFELLEFYGLVNSYINLI